MRTIRYVLIAILLTLGAWASAAHAPTMPFSHKSLHAAFAHRHGCLVLINCASATRYRYHRKIADKKLPPCSTFKIWNTLIGLESGLLSSADAPFYTWDGVTRSIPAWNQDLTLRQAFQASCVPAFQALARRIGAERMRCWMGKLGYGDRDISAGIDAFWLPARGRKTLLITPEQQAVMVYRLVTGQLPCAEKSRAVLEEIMSVKKTARGAFYGKTGTGSDATGQHNLGWFVGYFASNGQQYAFACLLKGDTHLMGKDARDLVQTLLETQHML